MHHENNEVCNNMHYNIEETYLLLDKLGAKIWKILPLFEGENEYLQEYVECKILKTAVMNSARYVEHDIKNQWFIEITTGLSYVLSLIEKSKNIPEDTEENHATNEETRLLIHKEIRSAVFDMTNLLSRVKQGLGSVADVKL